MQLIELDGEYINANVVSIVKKTDFESLHYNEHTIRIETLPYLIMTQKIKNESPLAYKGSVIEISYKSKNLRDEAFDDLIDTLRSGRNFSIDEFREDCYTKDDKDDDMER